MENRSPAMVVVYTFLTCGIYFFYWLYVTSKDLKGYLGAGDDVNPSMDLVLSIICFPYVIYWFYKYGKLLFEAQKKAGIASASDESTLYLILTLLGLGVVSMAIMQGNLNKLV